MARVAISNRIEIRQVLHAAAPCLPSAKTTYHCLRVIDTNWPFTKLKGNSGKS